MSPRFRYFQERLELVGDVERVRRSALGPASKRETGLETGRSDSHGRASRPSGADPSPPQKVSGNLMFALRESRICPIRYAPSMSCVDSVCGRYHRSGIYIHCGVSEETMMVLSQHASTGFRGNGAVLCNRGRSLTPCFECLRSDDISCLGEGDSFVFVLRSPFP